MNTKLTPHSLSFKITGLFCLSLMLIITSCKKNDTPPSKEQKLLEEWYKKNIPANHISFSNMKPIWESTFVSEQPNQLDVYEVALSNPNNVYQRLSNNVSNEKAHLQNNIRLLIFKDKTNGQIITGCYMSILNEAEVQSLNEIHYKQTKNLSGKIMFFNMDGKLENGWEYAKGIITKRINGSLEGYYFGAKNKLGDLKNPAVGEPESRFNKLMTYTPPTCAFAQPDWRTSCVGVDGYMECTTYLAGYFCVDQTPGGGGDGGYNPYPSNPGPGGGGGSTNPSVIASELNTDSIGVKFPCAAKLILKPIFNLQSMNDFVNPFLTSQRPTITYKTANLAWPAATTGGLFELGNTIYDPNSGLNRSTIVTLNEKMLQNSSPLLIASTTIHETIHSYIYYNISLAEYEVKNNYNDNGNWMISLNGFYLIRDLPANYSNHTMMLTSYFDKALAVLTAWDATQATHCSEKELAMAMLYGLNTVDPGTPQNLVNNINSAFQSIKTKYGITDAQLTTFNRDNLNSANKLPTTGCN